jgi:hypothetical protein
LTAPATECKKLSASKAPDPGRHHVGTPGDIISECPGDFVGIRTVHYLGIRLACEIKRKDDLGELALGIGARAAVSALHGGGVWPWVC